MRSLLLTPADGSRFSRAAHKPAMVAAGIYLCGVVGAYVSAATAGDNTELAFLPFMLLASPWSSLMYPLAEQIPNHTFGAVVYLTLSFVFSGVNALALYWLVVIFWRR